MKVGMMWSDSDPKTDLPTKVKKAVDYFYKKYGVFPDRCILNPDTLADFASNEILVGDKKIQLVPKRYILLWNFWIGSDCSDHLEKKSE